MPPAAAQSLKQRRSVCVAAGLSLHQVNARLLVGLLGAQQREVACIAVLPLTLGEIQRDFCGIGCGRRCLEPFGILASAASVSATFWQAARTVLRYWAAACT